MFARRFAALASGTILFAFSGWAAAFTLGDVFAAVGNGQVKEFTPNGTLVQILNDGSGSTFTTGMAFDSSGNLYVTNFSGTTVSKFNNNGTLANTNFLTGYATPESILLDASGNFYVGGNGSATIAKYSSSGGAPAQVFSVAGGNGTGHTDWIDLAADQHTILYDGEGTVIHSYNLTTQTENAVFGTAPNASVFAFRIIPNGGLAGEVLAADSTHAILLSTTGALLRTYTLPGNGNEDFALNLDPNGTDFWTSDAATGNIWEVNIATGAIDHQFLSGNPANTFGLVVFGEITAGGPPPPPSTPEPGTIALVVLGGLGLATAKRRNLLRK
jgi:hypothetical protein